MRCRVGCRVLGLVLLLPGLAPGEEAPLQRGLGEPVADFALKQAGTERVVRLSEAAGPKATVLVFLGTDCPIGNLYLPRLSELQAEYGPKGVAFLGINANASESDEAIAAHAREAKLGFPVLRDPESRTADQLQALRTCEALVLDANHVLRYRGCIDDQYRVGSRRDRPVRRFLAEAVEAVVAGRGVENPATNVDGCPIERPIRGETKASARPIDRVRPAPPAIVEAYRALEGEELPEVGAVSYAKDVAAILQKRCQSCHRPGQVGPFSLLTYEDAKRWAVSISEVVEERRMPPWHADPRIGHFENDRHLTPKERATLFAWVDQECPPGDLAASPANPTFPEEWSAGTPDLVFELPETYTVQAEGVVPYQRFVVHTNFKEDVWVQAAEARPGDRSVVHHIIVYVLTPTADAGRPRAMHLCGYAPGDMPSVYPPGIAKRIPAGSDLVFEMHYTPIGKIRTDRSKVGLTLSKVAVEREAITRPIANEKLEIPPNVPNQEVTSSWTFSRDSVLLSFMPHMHLRGKDFRYTARYPDGREEELLSVPAYDFNWQSYYRLATPKKMPKGTTIACVAHFDNSPGNPALRDDAADRPVNEPTWAEPVRWGNQTWEEMMIGYIDYIPDVPVTASTTPAGGGQSPQIGRMLLRRAMRELQRKVPATAATKP